MNSFIIPALGGQIYAMEGMQTKLHLVANELGQFNGRSTNYSGSGFSGMKFIAKSSSQIEFDKWINTIKSSPNKLTMKTYEKLILPSENNKPEFFSSVTKNLFNKIIMKFMPPSMHASEHGYNKKIGM